MTNADSNMCLSKYETLFINRFLYKYEKLKQKKGFFNYRKLGSKTQNPELI